MVLVEYSDTDSDGSDDGYDSVPAPHFGAVGSQNAKRKRSEDEVINDESRRVKLPALPPAFHSLYAANVRGSTRDDPSLHEGRQRQIPHIQGNWPSHVYLDWFPPGDDLAQLDEIISMALLQFESEETNKDKMVVHSSLRSNLGVQLPLHVSLSAPIVLQTLEKDDFTIQLAAAFKARGIDSFDTIPNGLAWVSNFDESRFFLVLRLSRPERNQFNELLAACNEVCRAFNLPCLYQNTTVVGVGKQKLSSETASEDQTHAFHISIAWTLQKPSEETKQNIEKTNLGLLRQKRIKFGEVRMKVGNIITTYELSPLR